MCNRKLKRTINICFRFQKNLDLIEITCIYGHLQGIASLMRFPFRSGFQISLVGRYDLQTSKVNPTFGASSARLELDVSPLPAFVSNSDTVPGDDEALGFARHQLFISTHLGILPKHRQLLAGGTDNLAARHEFGEYESLTPMYAIR
ncbi:MAG: hypothetical protein CVU18_16525 [Betaproteobacteria bacterium HGW-Betaproteobacteria-12]|nr:MAG: hypothetical protein CVU18_16525 [Betaproteobacteria bacterium HGW-Betaproteobacteria-12]